MRNKGSRGATTHQYWDPNTQWGDFEFVHPTRNMLVRVYVRTLTLAYNEECEEKAREALPQDNDDYGDFMKSFIPNHGKSGSKSRPKIVSYTMQEPAPQVATARRARWALERKNATLLSNSGTVFVHESIRFESTNYGIFVTLVVDMPELRETDFPLLSEYALGIKKVDGTPKTFSRATILQNFGYPSDADDDTPIFQSIGVKM